MSHEVSSPITHHQNGVDRRKNRIIQESARAMIHVKRMPFQLCAEIVAAGSSCSQNIWTKQMLTEYNVSQDVVTLYCDNLNTINISKNPIQHSRTKHIDLKHYLIRDLVEEKTIKLEHVATKLQLADIFTKALDANQFENLRGKMGICQHEKL